ncbi:hypothetical protein AGLY_013259 [Aphis glycines]|uniref:Uncharacterized protein n=1 Tax=Aphis glycines TaxID=307491 RepID=A0A6G0T5T3_APHGL|nr:hypothetical protein AGLY_013259 [Aphis glycines]
MKCFVHIDGTYNGTNRYLTDITYRWSDRLLSFTLDFGGRWCNQSFQYIKLHKLGIFCKGSSALVGPILTTATGLLADFGLNLTKHLEIYVYQLYNHILNNVQHKQFHAIREHFYFLLLYASYQHFEPSHKISSPITFTNFWIFNEMLKYYWATFTSRIQPDISRTIISVFASDNCTGLCFGTQLEFNLKITFLLELKVTLHVLKIIILKFKVYTVQQRQQLTNNSI